MSEAEAQNGPPMTPIGWLQAQINALEAGISGGTRIPFGTSLQLIAVGQAVAKGASGNTIQALAGLNNGTAASPIGIAIENSLIQTSGVATLPTADWDVITSQVGGLTPGATYCVGPGAGLYLIDCSSGEGGSIPAPVGAIIGVALSATELLITPSSPPNTIADAAGVTAAAFAVVQGSAGFGSAIATSLVACANTVGVVALAGGGGVNSIVGITGSIVDLSTGVWDTVTGQSGGLTKDAIYYLSDATAGHLLPNNPPVATGTFALRIGVALSTTRLLVQIGTPIGPHA